MRWAGILGLALFVVSTAGLLWINSHSSNVPTEEARIQRNSLVQKRGRPIQLVYFTETQDVVRIALISSGVLSVVLILIWLGRNVVLGKSDE
jgi:hypothetical protein